MSKKTKNTGVSVINFNSTNVVPITTGSRLYDSSFGVIMPRVSFDLTTQDNSWRSPYGATGATNGGNFYTFLIDAAVRSETSQQCLKTITEYLYGGGLGNYRDTKIGSTTLNKLFRQLCEIVPYSNGVAIRIYDNNTLEAIPFENVRYQMPDGYIYKNNRFKEADNKQEGLEFKIKKVTVFDWFGRGDATLYKTFMECDLEIGKDIILNFQKTNFDLFYPIPQYYASLNSILAESESALWLYNSIKNGFSGNTIMKMEGDPEDQVIIGYEDAARTKPIYQSARENLDDRLTNKFTGGGGNKILVIWGRQVELEPVDTSIKDTNLLTDTKAILQQSIAAGFDVAPTLANIMIPGKLGNTQEIPALMQMQKERVKPMLDMILDTLYEALCVIYSNVDKNALYTVTQLKDGAISPSVPQQLILKTDQDIILQQEAQTLFSKYDQ